MRPTVDDVSGALQIKLALRVQTLVLNLCVHDDRDSRQVSVGAWARFLPN